MNIWSSSSGRIELNLNQEAAGRGYHPGPCDDDIAALMHDPAIANQLAALDPAIVASELKEYGGDWDDFELSNHKANLARLLWIACADLIDQEYGIYD